MHQRRRRHVALKRCFGCLDPSDVLTLQRTYREVAVLRQLHHRHIVALRGAVLPEACSDLYLSFDVVDADLERTIRTSELTERQQGRITCHVLRALAYLHCSMLVHRDVKPSNILVSKSGRATLCDFGLVRYVGPYPRALTEYVGMRWYRAPELLLGSRRYSGGVDVWSLGCVVGEMPLGRPLLQGCSAVEQLALIVGLLLGRPPDEDEADIAGVEPEAVEAFLRTQPAGEPLDRRLAGAAAGSADVVAFVRSCLALSPSSRPSARDLLTTHPFLARHRLHSDDVSFMEHVSLSLRDDVVDTSAI
mmetsp:Transcript_155918/g.499900  ORF Transcript_155918/g.499900 Transcript_155918/m.499900 type:complete len:305 (-) Transcript_155918:161-1075(-)